MKRNFKSKNINFLLLLFLIILVMKIIFFGVKMFLPISGVDKPISAQQKPFFYTFKATNKRNAPIKKKVIKKTKKNIASIKKFELIALYNSKNTKLATIKYNKKIEIVLINEIFEAYKLIEIEQHFVILNKDGKDFKLEMKENNKNYNTISEVKRGIREEKRKIGAEFESVEVKRSKINYYKNNFNKIWKNIAIVPNKKGVDNDGFRLVKINKNSDFYELGLRKGDIIKEINGRELKSNKDAFYFFKNLDEIDMLRLTIIRGNEIKEIEYEVR